MEQHTNKHHCDSDRKAGNLARNGKRSEKGLAPYSTSSGGWQKGRDYYWKRQRLGQSMGIRRKMKWEKDAQYGCGGVWLIKVQ